MRLLLVRHGQTTSNVDGLLDTAHPGADLTERGREQAAAVVDALAAEPLDTIWVSTLTRTHQTAAPLAHDRGLTPVQHAGLREIAAGDVEMRGDEDAVRAYLSVLYAWAAGDLDVRMPGAETGREVLDRVDQAVAAIASTGVATAAAFSHGAVLRLWAVSRCHNLDGDIIGDRLLSNTGVIVLDGDPQHGWTCVTWEGEPLGGARPRDIADDGPTA